MPNISCFCVFDCAGMDIVEKDKNHEKTANTSMGLWKERSKAGAREDFIVKNPQIS
jgi:hypothetical protein